MSRNTNAFGRVIVYIEDFEEEIEKRKGKEVLQEQQGAAVNVVSDTGDQAQRDVAVVERVNVSAENFVSCRLGGTERAFTENSVDAAVAEVQAGGRRLDFSRDEEQRDTSPGLQSVEDGDVMAAVLAQFDSLGSSGNTFQGHHSQPSGLGTTNLNTLELQSVAQSRWWSNNVLLNDDFNLGAEFGGNSVRSSSRPSISTSGQRNRGASTISEKIQSKCHHLEHKGGDVGSGRRTGEVGDRRDGDVGVVAVGDVGAGGDGNATDTMQDKRGKTKRSKATVMFSTDKEDSFTTYAKSKRELDKRKTTTRKRKDEEKDDDGREAEVEDAAEEDDDDDKNDEEQQKGAKQLKKSFKTFSKRVNVKLPKVELPKFDGSVTEWMSFRDFFGNAVHRNSSLSKIDKFTYLKASLTGKAAETIAGLPLTSANYDSVWGLLEKQSGDKQRLIANFMDKLVKISSVAESRDVARLRGFLGQVEVIIRGLQSLSVDESTFGSLLIPILLAKLPEDIKLQVTRLISSEIWDLRELLQLLSKEIEAREKCAFSTNRDKVSGQSGKPFAVDYTTSFFVSKTQEKGCVFCSGQHSSHRCLVVQSPQERKKKLMQNERCFRCLSSEHLSRVCKVERGCFKCGQMHHRAICFKLMSKTRAEGNNSGKGRNCENSSRPAGAEDKFRTDKVSKGSDREQTSSLCSSSGTLVLLETAVTGVSNGKDEACRGRILLDKCSQQSYITEEFAGRCRLKVVGRKIFAVNAFGSNAVQQVEQNVYEASIQTLSGKMVVHLVGMSTICSPLLSPCNVHAVKGQHRYLSNLQLADDFKDDVVGALSVNVLIGSDLYYKFVTSRVIVGCYGNKLSAVSSKFGWVLSGSLQCGDEQSESSVGTFLSSVQGADTLSEKVEFFWNLESLGIKTEEDTMPEDFQKTVTFNGERYVTKLPWNGNEEFLQDHKKLATSRLESTTRSIIAKGRCKEYDDVLREQVGAGLLEEVPEQDINTSNRCHYTPHHAVIREDKATTKLRVVLDGAARSSKFDFSINDCLSKGPNLLVSLFAILLRFRLFHVTVLADIEKAFLQVCVHQDDIDALRILWYKNPFDRNRKVAVFRYLRVVFGFVCSPFLLNATIRYHLQRCLEKAQSEKDKVMLKSLIDSFYVDDLTLSIPTVEEAEGLISLSDKVIGEAGGNG